jgi:two-component sensor histidine kinase
VKNWPRLLLLVLLVWTAIALLDGLSTMAVLALRGQAGTVTWFEVFRHPLVEQWIWAVLTPVVLWAAGRVPLARPRLARAIALHAVLFVALSATHGALAQWLDEPLARPPGYAGSMLLLLLRLLREAYSDLWMYWPLVGLRALLDAQSRQRAHDREAARLQQLTADLRLSLLRAQIQPHFLFNTLHAISALLKTDPRAADDLVSDLADILRASFADASGHETVLSRELELVACYLRIQQHRLGERLAVRWQVDDDTRGAAVPALVLQSLVENAVVHGLAPRPRGGLLEIHASRVRADGRDDLRLVVRDDGVGLPVAPGAAGTGPGAAAHDGIGLANARDRLERLYGATQHLEIETAPGLGTTILLVIPFRAAGPDVAPSPAPHDPTDTNADRGRRAAGPAQPAVAA